MGALAGKVPYRSGLLVAAHTLVLVEGVSASFFPLALVEAAAAAFPLASALALAWILLVELKGPKSLVPWTACLEAMVVFGFFALPFSPYKVIRETLEEMAAEQDLSFDAIDLRESHPGIYVYSLRGTRKSIALREVKAAILEHREKRGKSA